MRPSSWPESPFFSLEMSAEQIGIRLVASEADVDSHRMRVGLLNSQEEQREHDAIGYLSGLPIYIDETPFQRIVEMRSKITRLHNEEPIDLLIVDYIQLIAGSSGPGAKTASWTWARYPARSRASLGSSMCPFLLYRS